MAISLILAHPNKASFNHAIAQTADQVLRRLGHNVHYHDLCQEHFEPRLGAAELGADCPLDPIVQQHCREISQTQGIIIVHPNWWGQPPAILKGWIDRVLRMGVAYRFQGSDGVPVGLLKAEAALVFNTSNTPQERELAVFGDPLERLWKTCVFDFCGVKICHRTNYAVIISSTIEQRRAWLADVRDTVQRAFPSPGRKSTTNL